MDVADLLQALGLSADPPMLELERLPPEERDALCRAVAERAADGGADDDLVRRLAILEPACFHDHLDALDPAGPAAVAFDGAPWGRIQHWEEELIQHPGGIPALDETGAPADRLAAALTVFARSKSPNSLARIEGWLGEASPEQREAASVVLGAAGIGVARGQRAVPVWNLPARRLAPPTAAAVNHGGPTAVDVILGPAVAGPDCAGCRAPLVPVLLVAQPRLGDLALRSDELVVFTCPSCLGRGASVFLTLGREGAIADVDVDKAESASSTAASPLVLPAGPERRPLTAASHHDDGGRRDRPSLSRIGGAPTFVGSPLSLRSPKSGEPMVFVGQLYLEASDALLFVFYCSEDALLATCAQHYAPGGS